MTRVSGAFPTVRARARRDSARWRAKSNVYDARMLPRMLQMLVRPMALLALLTAPFGCSSTSVTSPLIVARPYDTDIPVGYDKSKAYPLLVLLHGYGENGFVQDAYFGFNVLADQRGVLVAHPDGTLNASGQRFWNATDACCDFGNSGVDDVAYLEALVDDAKQNFHIDDKRVFFVGHSNGAFMSHRMACDAADQVAGIVALAGDVWKDPSHCNPSTPVAVLQVHGTVDTMVPYDGSTLEPSAPQSVATWAQKNGCGSELVDAQQSLDLDEVVAGAETRIDRHACTRGAAELWTMQGVGHVPNFRQPDWGNTVLDWLMAHPKP
jgi:polyhydroxybutyrate depolymerase